MQALMLAAGMGKRIQKFTNRQTKCMLRVAERTLLEHTCEALRNAGINKMVMVVGYEHEKLMGYIKDTIHDIEIEYVCNQEYEITNNIYSLFLARNYLKLDDTILLESDLIYDKSIIKCIVENENENLAVVSKYEYWMDGTVCKLDSNGNIEEFIEKKDFNYDNVDSYYKTVNIYKFSKEFSEKKYIPFLEAYIKVYGKNQFYESVLKIISHIDKLELMAYDIGMKKWYEIDNAHDYNVAETMFQEEEKQLEKYEKQYGGYWRFPKMQDFCYLVNPYFPTPKFKRHLRHMFEELLIQYPSGMKMQKISASRIYDVNERNIIVGNGATELISVLGKLYSGKKIATPVPIFNEYLRCFKNNPKIGIRSIKDDYSLELSQLVQATSDADIIIVVSPDNPSGYMLMYDEMICFIEACHEKNVICVIDESFIDFADEEVRYTLLTQDILERYPNLIVVRSISKTYGVPGIRIGVLASGNCELIDKIQEELPVWNINSIAEYFLELLPSYKISYMASCKKMAFERAYLIKALEEISYLQVFQSQANYILCKVENIASRELATVLINKYDILIKDLSSKSGFNGESYVRIAVKDREENDCLINALRTIERSI